MKKPILFTFLLSLIAIGVHAQEKKSPKLVRFSNITEVAVGFQVGKTTQITRIGTNETELKIAGYDIPSPRFSSSFGAFVASRFFIGPGFSYMYQAKANNHPQQHHIAVFAHARLQLFKGLLRPYMELKGGYNHILPGSNAGIFSQAAYTWDGAFAEPALGMGVKLGGHAQLNISLGYQFLKVWNRAEGFTSVSSYGPELRDSYHRLLLSFGFSFF